MVAVWFATWTVEICEHVSSVSDPACSDCDEAFCIRSALAAHRQCAIATENAIPPRMPRYTHSDVCRPAAVNSTQVAAVVGRRQVSAVLAQAKRPRTQGDGAASSSSDSDADAAGSEPDAKRVAT